VGAGGVKFVEKENVPLLVDAEDRGVCRFLAAGYCDRQQLVVSFELVQNGTNLGCGCDPFLSRPAFPLKCPFQ
jgi:hypothetical protein